MVSKNQKRDKDFLDYLYDFSRIPVRIFNSGREEVVCVPGDSDFWLQMPFQKELGLAEAFPSKSVPRLISLNADLMLGCCSIGEGSGRVSIVAGPVYTFNQPFMQLPCSRDRQIVLSTEKTKLLLCQLPTISVQAFCNYLRLLLKQLSDVELSLTEIMEYNFPAHIIEDMELELFSTVFSQREQMPFHTPYEEERRFIKNIKNGNLQAVENSIRKTRDMNVGTLSSDPLRQSRYISIALITLVTRAAMEGGLEESFAFNLSDIYIQRIDAMGSSKEIMDLTIHMLRDFTMRVSEHKKKSNYSKPVAQAIHYIHQNLHNTLSVPQIAEQVSLSPDHLSRLFRKETGDVISSYIQKQRVEEAKDALRFSNYSNLEISNYLCFSSQSYFNQIFKKHTGLTPMEYRKKYQ